MFGTKPETAGWAGWHPTEDGPAERRANSVTVKVRGRLGDRGKTPWLRQRKRKGTKVAGKSFCGQELFEK